MRKANRAGEGVGFGNVHSLKPDPQITFLLCGNVVIFFMKFINASFAKLLIMKKF